MTDLSNLTYYQTVGQAACITLHIYSYIEWTQSIVSLLFSSIAAAKIFALSSSFSPHARAEDTPTRSWNGHYIYIYTRGRRVGGGGEWFLTNYRRVLLQPRGLSIGARHDLDRKPRSCAIIYIYIYTWGLCPADAARNNERIWRRKKERGRRRIDHWLMIRERGMKLVRLQRTFNGIERWRRARTDRWVCIWVTQYSLLLHHACR